MMRCRALLVPAIAAASASTAALAQAPELDWSPGSSSIEEREVVAPAYRGPWAPDPAACADPDGVERVSISAAGLESDESGGRPDRITQAGQDRSVRVKLSFEGEGSFWDSVQIWTLDERGNRLTMADADGNSPDILIRCSE